MSFGDGLLAGLVLGAMIIGVIWIMVDVPSGLQRHRAFTTECMARRNNTLECAALWDGHSQAVK